MKYQFQKYTNIHRGPNHDDFIMRYGGIIKKSKDDGN